MVNNKMMDATTFSSGVAPEKAKAKDSTVSRVVAAPRKKKKEPVKRKKKPKSNKDDLLLTPTEKVPVHDDQKRKKKKKGNTAVDSGDPKEGGARMMEDKETDIIMTTALHPGDDDTPEVPLAEGEDDIEQPIDAAEIEEAKQQRKDTRKEREQQRIRRLQARTRAKYIRLVAVSLLALMLCVGAFLAIWFPLTKDQRRQSEDSSIENGNLDATVAKIQDYIVGLDLSDRSDFLSSDMNSPQSHAIHWLAAFHDKYPIPTPKIATTPHDTHTNNVTTPLDDDPDAYQYATRYILAVFYHTMHGIRWKYQFNFMSSGDVCTWNGAVQDATKTTDSNVKPFGVFCNPDGNIWGLYLDNMNLQGSIPRELAFLSTMQVLDLSFNNGIQGNFPSELCQLSKLQDLSLGFTQMSGTLPSCLGQQVAELRNLFLSDTLMDGQLPAELNQLTKLQRLAFDDNAFSGDISTLFDGMPLEFLFLEGNNFSGVLDERFLASHASLVQLDLSGNQLQGSVPAHLLDATKNPKLELIDLHGNRLGGELPEAVAANEKLVVLALQGNQIRGLVPVALQNLTKLYHLDLANNLLEGPMPAVLGEMTNLTYLFLANNSFDSGPIPPEFAGLVNLEEISLKRTQRTGPLPDFIASWSKLVLLDLDQNNLSGAIPSSYGALSQLQFLLLNRNNLFGMVPQALESLTSLRGLFLEGNALTGDIDFLCNLNTTFQDPSGGFDGNNEKMIAADCAVIPDDTKGGGAPQVQCSCCEICCVPVAAAVAEEEADSYDDCHDSHAIASLDPVWEALYGRVDFDFGNGVRFDMNGDNFAP